MVKEKFKRCIKDNNAQKWFDEEYSKEEKRKKNIIELDFAGENLEGLLNLSLEDFISLKELNCSNNNLTQLKVVNCPNLETINCSNNQLIQLEIENCPKLKEIYCEWNKLVELNFSELKKLIKLQCQNNQLIELDLKNCHDLKELICQNNKIFSLDLINFSNLKEVNCCGNKLINLKFDESSKLERLYCSDNQLINLSLNNNIYLKELDCHSNQLVSLDVAGCNQLEKFYCQKNALKDLTLPFQTHWLKYLNLEDNNFPEQDLSIFRKFSNLRELLIDNKDKERITQEIYNRFYGSLEPLQKMENLRKLDISNTDISSGLTYLSENVKYFYYSTNLREDAQVKIIADDLKNEEGENFSQKLQSIKRKKNGFQIDQVILSIQHELIANGISATDLWKELKINSYEVDNDWQSYLKLSMSLDDLNIRKGDILKILTELKKVSIDKERRLQKELAKQREELEKKIKDLETNQLTEKERLILKNMEELFSVLGNFNNTNEEDQEKLAEMLNNYKKIDFETDAPNLSKIFKSGSESLFHKLNSFIKKNEEKIANSQKIQKNLQSEVFQLQANLEKARGNHQELIAELKKKDSELSDSIEMKKKLEDEIDFFQKKIEESENELSLIPQKKTIAEKQIKGRVHEAKESTSPLRKKRKDLDNEEKYLQKSLQDLKKKLESSNAERKKLQEFINKAKKGDYNRETNFKLKIAEEKIKKLEKELFSQLKKTEEESKSKEKLKIKLQNLPNLEKQQADLKKQLAKKESETKILQQQAEEFKSELQQAEAKYQQIAAELAKRNERLITTNYSEEELREAKEEIEQLEEKLKEIEKELDSKEQEVVTLQKEIMDKEGEIKKIKLEKQIEIDRLETEKEKLKLELDNLQNKLQTNENKLTAKNQELKEVKLKLSNERQQSKSNETTKLLRSLRNEEEKLKKEVEDLAKENNRLKKQLKQTENKITINITNNSSLISGGNFTNTTISGFNNNTLQQIIQEDQTEEALIEQLSISQKI